jgi:hypothetical protein
MKKRVLFTDQDIVDFCRSTQDTNVVHDQMFMTSLNKRVIVPGMYAFCMTANLAADFILGGANYFRVYFNTLLSSGDFADLCAISGPGPQEEIRLSALNHKDTLSSPGEHTSVMKTDIPFVPQDQGHVLQLPVTGRQVETFRRLISTTNGEVGDLLFTMAYASQALFRSIREPATDVEQEIISLVDGGNRISPFYHTLEIFLPTERPSLLTESLVDYRIHFERVKANRAYLAGVQCEQQGRILYRSVYKLVGIRDSVILRMAKEVHHNLK